MLADTGPYGVAKILATDEEGVHLRLYEQRYPERPAAHEVGELTLSLFLITLKGPLSVGHIPLTHNTFEAWQPLLVMTGGRVADNELAGYRDWKESEGGYF